MPGTKKMPNLALILKVVMSSSAAGARLSSAPAQLCPRQRVWELGAELSCWNDGSNSGTAAQVTASSSMKKGILFQCCTYSQRSLINAWK